MPFRWTINPYRGCSHACRFCFARSTHLYLDLDAGRDFEREIVVKVNVPEVLRAELRGRRGSEQVALGTNTDPYQWVESRYRLMPGIWQALLDFDTPCSLVTKSPLALRDIDILQQLAAGPGVTVFFSVPTLDERAGARRSRTRRRPARGWRRCEDERGRDSVRRPDGALMPGINDSPEQVGEILRIAEDAGAISAAAIALHLRRSEGGLLRLDACPPGRPDAALRGALPQPLVRDLGREGTDRGRGRASGHRGASAAAAAAGPLAAAEARARQDPQATLF